MDKKISTFNYHLNSSFCRLLKFLYCPLSFHMSASPSESVFLWCFLRSVFSGSFYYSFFFSSFCSCCSSLLPYLFHSLWVILSPYTFTEDEICEGVEVFILLENIIQLRKIKEERGLLTQTCSYLKSLDWCFLLLFCFLNM